jgi:KaiC/GvpD/RAD55 family RecA-like ATPase
MTKAEIQKFLDGFKDGFIQTADDAQKGRRELVTLAPVGSYTLDQLFALNSFGAAIWFTPNPCSGGRTEKNITAIRWVYADLDYETKDKQMERIKNAPLKPSMVIESKKSFHVYYRADIAFANWERIVGGVIQHFNADTALSSFNEVLRVPGFSHMKNEAEPFEIKLIEKNDLVYTEEDLVAKFPYKSFDLMFEEKFGRGLEAVKRIDIRDVLRRLGVEVKNNQVFIEGEGSSMMVNVKGNYIHRFSGKEGSGSTIDAVMYFKKYSIPQAVSWLKSEYGIADTENLFIPYGDLVQLAADRIRKTSAERLCSYHLPWLNGKLGGIFKGELVVVGADTGLGKSEFVINLAHHNAERGKKILFYELEMENDEVTNRRVFKRMNNALGEKYLPKKDFYLNNMTDEQTQCFDLAVARECEVGDNIKLYNGNALNLEKFLQTFKAEASTKDLVIIDHLHYFSTESENASQEIGLIMRAVKDLTKTYRVPIVLVSHVVKMDKNKEPELNHFYGSSNIPKEANTCIMLARDIETDYTTVYIKKSRMIGRGYKQDYEWDEKRGELIEKKPLTHNF